MIESKPFGFGPFIRFITVPEINDTTITIFGSEVAVKKELQRACEQKTWMVHPLSAFRKYWLVMLILATFANVIVIPLGVSFFTQEVHYSISWISLNAIVDALFILDLCLNFRTGYWDDENDDVVLKPNKIRNHYLKTWFIPDLLAVLPVDHVILIIETLGFKTHASGMAGVRMVKLIKLVRLFSLLRLLRFSRLLRYAQNWEEVQGWNVGSFATVLQFLHMVVMIILMCHWNACFHFLMATIQEFPETSWIAQEGLQNKSISMQYTRCMFRSLCHMMTLNYGSVEIPKGMAQLWVDIVSMMVGTVMYALVLARMTALVTHSKASENVFKSKHNELSQYLHKNRIPIELRQRAYDHLSGRFQGRWFDEHEILMQLNEPLRKEIMHYNCSHLFQNHPTFKASSPLFLSEVMDMLQFEYYLSGDIIIKSGSLGDCMYFIERGEVQVDTPGFSQILSDGSFFGELCLMSAKARRCATVKAVTACRLYSLNVNNYRKVLERFPEELKDIDIVAKERLKTLSSTTNSEEDFGCL